MQLRMTWTEQCLLCRLSFLKNAKRLNFSLRNTFECATQFYQKYVDAAGGVMVKFSEPTLNCLPPLSEGIGSEQQ